MEEEGGKGGGGKRAEGVANRSAPCAPCVPLVVSVLLALRMHVVHHHQRRASAQRGSEGGAARVMRRLEQPRIKGLSVDGRSTAAAAITATAFLAVAVAARLHRLALLAVQRAAAREEVVRAANHCHALRVACVHAPPRAHKRAREARLAAAR